MKKAIAAAALLAAVLTTSWATAQSTQTAPSTPTQPSATTAAPSTAPSQNAVIDINSATSEQLQTLTGIGPTRAEAIVKGPPYKAKDELHRKSIIPQSVYDGIKDRIIARQS
jgi:DNA uptake protein ComE-like DNA-binding protein